MRRAVIALATLAMGLSASAAADAAIVTVGPTLNGVTVQHHAVCEHQGKAESFSYCMFAQDSPSYVSKVTGKIVAWRVKGATGMVSLRVLHGNTGLGGSLLQTPTGPGKEVFAAEIPIEAGDRFGVQLYGKKGEIGEIGRDEPAGASFSGWTMVPGFEETRLPDEPGLAGRLLLNADIQPAPTITGVSPVSAPLGAAVPVTITGHDFEEVKAVAFGSDFAVPYEVVSETEIVAHPTGIIATTVQVQVTTRAGTATAPGAFTFEPAPISEPTFPGIPPVAPLDIPPVPPVDIPPLAFPPEPPECHVPKLKRKKLKQVKPLLEKAHCKLGKVTRRKGLRAGRGKVVGETPPAGSRARQGWRIQVKLG